MKLNFVLLPLYSLISVFFALTACDRTYEISRLVPVDTELIQAAEEKECILETLASFEEVKHTSATKVPPKSSWSPWSGTEQTPSYEHYRFETDLGFGGLYVKPTAGVQHQLKVYFLRLNRKFSEEEKVRAQALVNKIAAAINERCAPPSGRAARVAANALLRSLSLSGTA